MGRASYKQRKLGRSPHGQCVMVRTGPHANTATGAFGGAPYGATNRVRGVPKWGSMRGADACEHAHLGLRWSSLWGHDPREGCAEMGAVPPCERSHWGLRRSSLWGHETCERCAEIGAVPACERSHLGLRWSSLWGHKKCEGVPNLARCRRANAATGAFGGAPSGATKRCPGRGNRMRPPPTGAFGGGPYGATKRCPGWGRRMRVAPRGPAVDL